ncbi:amidohydrolase family protein [Aurantibacter sp.]|uniref:amidohydrolase family protein n=1 Tax=Aurantibacter sp. TaxID=2807103 RepID=UPI0032667868
MKNFPFYLICLLFIISCKRQSPNTEELDKKVVSKTINALNRSEIAKGNKTIAIIGATLVDGTGNKPLENVLVIIKNDLIDFVGEFSESIIPNGAELVNVEGMTLLPGLIDAHYHGESEKISNLFLKKGITSVRDPGAWNSAYDIARKSGKSIPRLFLTGPHIDSYPPAYPKNSFLIQDPEEGRLAVNKFADEGATAIKVYYRLSIDKIKAICETAHERGIPVTAHLEISNAVDAINAGLDGIEHITSFGTSLLSAEEGERYKNLILADNNARRKGRYEVWNSLNIDNNPKVDSIVSFIVKKKTFISPTLAVFEKKYDKADSLEVNAFTNMLKFVGRLNKGGAKIVVGSHTYAPYAEFGNAYYQEMELLKAAGLTNMEVIVAATHENAKFFRVEKRLGTIEKGKIADLILLRENPLKNLEAMNTVEKVMLNGVFQEF